MPEMMRGSVWPAIVAAYQRSTMGLSCMLAPQYDYEDENYPVQAEFLYHMKRLAEQYPVYYGMGNHEYRMKVYRKAYGNMFE